MNRILDNRERAKNLTVAFYIMLGICVVALISDFLEYQLLKGDYITMVQNADSNDQRQIIIGIIVLIINIVLIVLFIQWFRRAYHNLHKAGEKNLVSTEGWAAGWWFIPFANWFMPYRIMREIWDRTCNYGQSDIDDLSDTYDASIDAGAGEVSNDSVNIVNFWWAFWIASNIISTISTQIIQSTSANIESIQFASLLGLISDVGTIIAIFLAVKMVKSSQIHQNRFLRAVKNKDQSSFGISNSDDILD
ncbi:MAG: hypothetical protein ACI8ZM_005028 [Crocinitomix sp.]|jgi:hypothetical protein